jgi:hypothetical protein
MMPSARRGPAKYERLVAVKERYDPATRFRFNHNILPRSAGQAAEQDFDADP